MALIFLGSSECPLCNKILQKGDEIIGLPPIAEIGNPYIDILIADFIKNASMPGIKNKKSRLS